jgi:hypothetical protein
MDYKTSQAICGSAPILFGLEAWGRGLGLGPYSSIDGKTKWSREFPAVSSAQHFP